MPPSADETLAQVNFVVWLILVAELVCLRCLWAAGGVARPGPIRQGIHSLPRLDCPVYQRDPPIRRIGVAVVSVLLAYGVLYDIVSVQFVKRGKSWYLQVINFQDADNYTSIDYLLHSVEAWSKAMVPQAGQQNRALTRYLISVSIRPPICYDDFSDIKIGNHKFHVGENCPPWSWSDEGHNGGCIYGILQNITEETTFLLDVADTLSQRVGSMKTFESQSEITNSTFVVSATCNYTQVVRFRARFSFFVELLLMAIIIEMLTTLRLTEIRHHQGTARSNTTSDSGSYDLENEDGDQLVRTYETEQLVTAVSKITDLLRKCYSPERKELYHKEISDPPAFISSTL